MKCPKCGIEMIRKKLMDGRSVWICRNPRCSGHGREMK